MRIDNITFRIESLEGDLCIYIYIEKVDLLGIHTSFFHPLSLLQPTLDLGRRDVIAGGNTRKPSTSIETTNGISPVGTNTGRLTAPIFHRILFLFVPTYPLFFKKKKNDFPD